MLFSPPQQSVLERLVKFHCVIFENLILTMYFHYRGNYSESSHIQYVYCNSVCFI